MSNVESQTRMRILDAAQDLIQRLGANAMSYQHISEAVGIRKASIHHHFPTKEMLIEALLERYNRYFFELIDNIIQSDLSPKEKLQRYIDLFEATLSSENCDKACLCGILGAEITTLGLPSATKIKSFHEGNERRLAIILKEGLKARIFRFQGDPVATASLVFSLLEGAVLIVRARGGAKQFRKIAKQLMVLLNG